MSFSGDMNRLQAIIDEFESEGLGVEASLALFEEGVGLVRSCREYLGEAKRRVTILTSEQEVESDIADGE
ncbi:MAG: exodeoxyribonuclease VII small subunit [Synergistaceae bacterium]|jgi:exodeoxyribonuclease VII small subunit|nr:exodeoxyribonuclease VII small subunit [Synergistaceae bacterium]